MLRVEGLVWRVVVCIWVVPKVLQGVKYLCAKWCAVLAGCPHLCWQLVHVCCTCCCVSARHVADTACEG